MIEAVIKSLFVNDPVDNIYPPSFRRLHWHNNVPMHFFPSFHNNVQPSLNMEWRVNGE